MNGCTVPGLALIEGLTMYALRKTVLLYCYFRQATLLGFKHCTLCTLMHVGKITFTILCATVFSQQIENCNRSNQIQEFTADYKIRNKYYMYQYNSLTSACLIGFNLVYVLLS